MRRITNVRLPRRPGGRPEAPFPLWSLEVDQNARIHSVTAMRSGAPLAGESWQGDWLSPMAVDLQINGGLGLAFPELTEADLPQLLQLLARLWDDGVEAISPTLVTCAVAPLRQALAVLRLARREADERSRHCRLLGAHLEGPFLAESRRGAHPRDHLCQPSLKALARRIHGFEDEIALVTLAPELDGASEVIARLQELQITVALGHSAADAPQAQEAFAQGVRMLTHAFNAMPGLHHRAPGPVAEACRHGGVALGLIADGVHVHPTMATLLQQLAGDQLVLVSDALAPYGLADGLHRWDNRALRVENGTCRLEDGTLAGVTLSQLEGACRLAAWGGRPEASIWGSTIAPREVLAPGDPYDLAKALVGCRLPELLRWSWEEDTSRLHWRHAA